jgi:hypothetical protein
MTGCFLRSPDHPIAGSPDLHAFLCYRLLPMEQHAPDTSGVLPAPRVIERTLRIVAGAVLLYFFAQLIRPAPDILAASSGWSVPGGSSWVGALDS